MTTKIMTDKARSLLVSERSLLVSERSLLVSDLISLPVDCPRYVLGTIVTRRKDGIWEISVNGCDLGLKLDATVRWLLS